MPKMASATDTPGAIGSPFARNWLTVTATAPPTRWPRTTAFVLEAGALGLGAHRCGCVSVCVCALRALRALRARAVAEGEGQRRAEEGAQAEEKHGDGAQRRAHDLDIAGQHGQDLRGGEEGDEAQGCADAGESRLLQGCHERVCRRWFRRGRREIRATTP